MILDHPLNTTILVLCAGIVIGHETRLGQDVGTLVISIYEPQVPPGHACERSEDHVFESTWISFAVLFFVRLFTRIILTSSISYETSEFELSIVRRASDAPVFA